MRHRRSNTVSAVSFLLGVVLFVGWVAVPAGPAHPQASNGSDGPSIAPVADEAAFVAPVPEPGDPRFEAAASDGSWVSYENPRDEYRSPYIGDGSGKFCLTLLNGAGEPIVGTTVPNTTVEMDTGPATSWHSGADPMTVRLPLTDHYEVPLDADQFGTSSAHPQGDGRLDSHCIEFHGVSETSRITFDEVAISGDHAEDIRVVGYVLQANDVWNTSVDPLADAQPYVATGGQWSNEPNGSHGQVVAVLQLDREPNTSRTAPSDSDTDESIEPPLVPVIAIALAVCAVALGGWFRIRR